MSILSFFSYLRWLCLLWNHAIAPTVEDTLRKTASKSNSATEQNTEKLAITALYVLLQRAVFPGCPLPTEGNFLLGCLLVMLLFETCTCPCWRNDTSPSALLIKHKGVCHLNWRCYFLFEINIYLKETWPVFSPKPGVASVGQHIDKVNLEVFSKRRRKQRLSERFFGQFIWKMAELGQARNPWKWTVNMTNIKCCNLQVVVYLW